MQTMQIIQTIQKMKKTETIQTMQGGLIWAMAESKHFFGRSSLILIWRAPHSERFANIMKRPQLDPGQAVILGSWLWWREVLQKGRGMGEEEQAEGGTTIRAGKGGPHPALIIISFSSLSSPSSSGVQNSWKCLGAEILCLAKCVNCDILPTCVKVRKSRHFTKMCQSA